MKKTNKKISLILLTLGVVAIVIGVTLLSLKAVHVVKQYKIKNEDIYMFFGDELFEFNSEITLNHENNITNMKLNDKNVELNSEPIYIKEKDEVIMPSDMSIVYPLDGVVQKRITYYSKLELINNKVKLSNNIHNNYVLENAFLYDGKDLYFFVEDTTIIIGDEKIEIPAFSYVTCKYKGDVFIFNYSTKNVKVYENVSDIVFATDGDYTVNLSYDVVEFNENSVLLIKNIKNLPNVR